jgi:hypothetical protein
VRRDENFENIIIDSGARPLPGPGGAGVVTPADPQFESDVAAVLGVLRKTWTGWAVLRAVYDRRKNKRKDDQAVRIVPFTAQERRTKGDRTAAFTRPDSLPASMARDGQGYKGGLDDPFTKRDERYDRWGFPGFGTGSGAEIHFDPGQLDSDRHLLHELVHAVRAMSGVIDRVPTEYALRLYDDEEEFYADVVANIYLSERGDDPLIRFGHSEDKSMDEFINDPDRPAKLDGKLPLTPAALLMHPDLGAPIRRLLAKMVRDTKDLCQNIAYKPRATMKWNLLREYMANPAKFPTL